MSSTTSVADLSELMITTEYTIFVVPFNAHQIGPAGQVSFFTSSSSPNGELVQYGSLFTACL